MEVRKSFNFQRRNALKSCGGRLRPDSLGGLQHSPSITCWIYWEEKGQKVEERMDGGIEGEVVPTVISKSWRFV